MNAEFVLTDLLALPVLAIGIAAVRHNVRLDDFDLASVRSIGVLLLGVGWAIAIAVRVSGSG